ncbi:MAG: elongation factor G [Thalassospira sp.]|nr:elongation factor G [Thalassospira sp.]MDP2697168.1 elongation factor G [Thalassospira sp.]
MTMPFTPHPPRVAALVGPYTSGKTSLLESLLLATGTLHRKGSVRDHNTIGDYSADSRERGMSTLLTVAKTTWLDEEWHFIDCPGSVDFAQDSREAAMICDVAVVVIEPDPAKIMTAAPILKYLDRGRIPHLIFINKADHAGVRLRDTLSALQDISDRPLVLREIPIRGNDGTGEEITGFVDVVSQRAYEYLDSHPSRLVSLPAQMAEREQQARDGLLETLADFDDGLLEKILEDQTPAPDEIYDNLGRDLANDLIVPVFFGSAEKDYGIRRLLKALRHEAPNADVCAQRLGIETEGNTNGGEAPVVQIFKTLHLPHAGRFCYGRVLSGMVQEGDGIGADRISGLCALSGDKTEKIASAGPGAIIGLPRMDKARTGQALGPAGKIMDGLWPDPLPPLYAVALQVNTPGDDVKLTEALHHLTEQDRSLDALHDPHTGQLVLRGQGDIHLQLALMQLRDRYHLDLSTVPVQTAYQETIRKPVQVQGRYKKQTGGHGQFGDVKITLTPQARGAGFTFTDKVVGGTVPRHYIPAVEKGIRDGMRSGPLGFPVVDFAVELTDGSYHAVDSSDQAFQMAARIALQDGLKLADPVILEPVDRIIVSVPSEFTSKAQRLVSARRGQIAGFCAKEGWQGWDEIEVLMPASETGDMVMELRSLSLGTGFFERRFAHMQELTGKNAAQLRGGRNTPK